MLTTNFTRVGDQHSWSSGCSFVDVLVGVDERSWRWDGLLTIFIETYNVCSGNKQATYPVTFMSRGSPGAPGEARTADNKIEKYRILMLMSHLRYRSDLKYEWYPETNCMGA